MSSRRHVRYSPLAVDEDDDYNGGRRFDPRFDYSPKAFDRVPWKSIVLAVFLLCLGCLLLFLSFFIFSGHMGGEKSQAYGLLVLGILTFLPVPVVNDISLCNGEISLGSQGGNYDIAKTYDPCIYGYRAIGHSISCFLRIADLGKFWVKMTSKLLGCGCECWIRHVSVLAIFKLQKSVTDAIFIDRNLYAAGFYETRIAYYSWRGAEGYSFASIPDY
ncbi:hypothetical protein Golob_016785 [Gossypium lobatum]|uniref:Transmembrane protein 230 n=1 Tax=Gossypium lobatum TaxID=34289 RepID=A0A7J8M5D6_9ROSI|nr:hypothetical protein [Gossypium lobatum]